MNNQPLLIPVPPSHVPPLVLARRRLDALQAEHDSALAQAEEVGTEHELDWSDEWRALCRSLLRAKEVVTELEREEVKYGGAK